MSTAFDPGQPGPFRALWKRAPAWRLCLMSAGVLTLTFALFPPKGKPEADAAQQPIPDLASYTPPPLPPEAPPVRSKPPLAAPPSVPVASAPTSLPAKTPAAPAPKASAAPPSAAPAAPVVAAISLAGPANAAAKPDTSGVDPALMGRSYSGSILIAGFKLPLPPGNWVVLANQGINIPTASGMAYFIGRIEKKRLTSALRVFAVRSKDKPGAGFEAIKGCERDNPNNLHAVIEAVTPFDHEACWTMYNYYTPPWQQWADKAAKIPNLDRAAAGDMAAKGVTYPQDFVGIRFTRAEKWGLFEVNILFSPEAEGIGSNTVLSFREADWHATNIGRFPDKAAYVNKLKEWGNSFWPQIKTAFDEAAPAGIPPVGASLAAPEPIAAYTSQLNQIVARYVRQVRVEQELAKIKETGHPVPLPTGTCSAVIDINADGTVRRAELSTCSSDSLGEVELAAIKRAEPLPPPGKAQTIVVRTAAPVATPGVDGN